MSQEFFKLMNVESELSMMGELNFFPGPKIKQTPNGTMIDQQKYVKEIFKRFNVDEAKVINTPVPPQ